VPPLALALVDSVFALALHHDQRVRRGTLAGLTSAFVRAEITGPESDGPAPGSLKVRIFVSTPTVPRNSVSFHIDLEEERLLAKELALAELPLDRSGLARLIGELEAWCYAQIPLEPSNDLPTERSPQTAGQ
jgi:hypothetical protein